ncbi:MAG: preprotein translocase subunit YajC [Bacteriovoracaceae bacterium]
MFDFIFTPAFAEGSANAAAQPSPFASFFPFIIIFMIFYFLMIRPQKKKLEEEKALLAGLNKGDEIYTKSGIIGTIYGLTDSVVTLEVAEGTKMKVLRSHIGGLAKKLFDKTEEKK